MLGLLRQCQYQENDGTGSRQVVIFNPSTYGGERRFSTAIVRLPADRSYSQEPLQGLHSKVQIASALALQSGFDQ